MIRLSYVIISYNRRDALLRTLQILHDITPLSPDQWEIRVVDNCSTDGSAEAVEAKFPRVGVIRNPVNQGMFARNHAFVQCRGQYIISLDDDSYPADGAAVTRLLEHMDRNPTIGALVARVVLPNGGQEAPAIPTVLMGGASCLRRSAIEQVGGFRPEFFRQAEEYDLSFRMWNAGHRIERADDVVFRHDKIAGAGRNAALVARLDLRNNLIVAERHLPGKLRKIYWDDWRLRYETIAQNRAGRLDVQRALWGARIWRMRDIFAGRTPLNETALENVLGIRKQARTIGQWARTHNVWRVILAGFSKNIYATYHGCQSTGVQMRCIADDNPAFDGVKYRGLVIAPLERAFTLNGIDGVVLTNTNPSQIDALAQSVRRSFSGPILRLWEPPTSTITSPTAAAA